MFRTHLIIGAVALGAVMALAPSAVRANTATLTVTASVQNTCQFTTISDTVAFGAYTGSEIDTTYAAKYSCATGDNGYKFSFKSANVTQPSSCVMVDGSGHSLNYNVVDSAGTAFTCDGFTPQGATNEQAGIGSGILTYVFTFKLLPNQAQVVGSYSDQNTVTITP